MIYFRQVSIVTNKKTRKISKVFENAPLVGKFGGDGWLKFGTGGKRWVFFGLIGDVLRRGSLSAYRWLLVSGVVIPLYRGLWLCHPPAESLRAIGRHGKT